MYFKKIFTKENLTVPNFLSVVRILLIIPFVYFFSVQQYIWAGAMVAFSGLTDCFDGMIARKLNQITELGKMLDPIADKLTLVAVALCMGTLFNHILIFVILLIAKDVLMLIGGYVLIRKQIKPPAALWYGKVATLLFYFSITVLVGLKAIWQYDNIILTMVLLVITTIAMIYALVRYSIIFFNLVKEKANKKDVSAVVAAETQSK